ncbi:hypothetical protein ACMD2_24852 [Ananas comosus]|uniref:Uncharacterized protein n=1 Tax=Ananas comosus TaxID=4615 RepID=A0A199V9A3_ANACO|nr:hypothetical protein ACMD2_24852 [Ananas comosus]
MAGKFCPGGCIFEQNQSQEGEEIRSRRLGPDAKSPASTPLSWAQRFSPAFLTVQRKNVAALAQEVNDTHVAKRQKTDDLVNKRAMIVWYANGMFPILFLEIVPFKGEKEAIHTRNLRQALKVLRCEAPLPSRQEVPSVYKKPVENKEDLVAWENMRVILSFKRTHVCTARARAGPDVQLRVCAVYTLDLKLIGFVLRYLESVPTGWNVVAVSLEIIAEKPLHASIHMPFLILFFTVFAI